MQIAAAPKQRRGARQVRGDTSAGGIQDCQIVTTGAVSCVTASIEQRRRVGRVCRHALAIGVEHAEIGAAQRIVSVARPLIQGGGARQVHGNAAAFVLP